MKRMISRLGTLLVLLTAGCYLYASSPIAAISCWEQAYNKWMGCDGAYVNTKNLYMDRGYYCANNAATTCSTSANTFCTAQATNSCSGHPDPQQCYNSAYSNCYLSQYQSCHTSTEVQCLQNVENAYNGRGNSYFSCLGIEGNYGNCVEEVEFSCVEAQNRAAACYSVYSGIDDGEASATCRANSGIDQCQ